MPSISVNKLVGDNTEALNLKWEIKHKDDDRSIDSKIVNTSPNGLIGHLNLIHPNWIQIFSRTEAAYFKDISIDSQNESLAKITANTTCFIISDGEACPQSILKVANKDNIPVLVSPLPSLQIIWVLRTYLGRVLADYETHHGVLLDVLGVGVMITGDSGVGKSELALELISRGSGLVADDVVELFHIAPKTVEGRSPELLKDFLEVRGLGLLNIRTIFGETAVRRRKNLKLIVELMNPGLGQGQTVQTQRLPLQASSQNILDVDVRKVQLPVAAGRNLAVLVEAAVRNYVLHLRGIDSTQEFMARQSKIIADQDRDRPSNLK
ncbi:MAG: HPr kinase/phosphorylase [Burkholderiales bacterium]|nr:HPr kinase/phosphorylase [Burkholderiales bacterium]OUT77871.1 MAG: HPr kinase/phosphorylase [Betaproteobacteria bacterium TMED22]|tara:strand:+ start:26784 stop:27752 length:969 start_codon:yes stop_codon:yes gene_type:complete